ncbi:MAG: hypothetical protein ACW9W3_01020 [Candidatus Nitrosopumilus sp. bin_68KS]
MTKKAKVFRVAKEGVQSNGPSGDDPRKTPPTTSTASQSKPKPKAKG